jgi:DNA (cytosine-5)-methyltransferase 1
MEFTSKESIPLLSFFTGAGFMDLGFLQNGFSIPWHNEYYGPFIKGFETGMSALGYNGISSTIQNTKSIIDVEPNTIIKEAFTLGKAPKLFGIIGGPPCPDFSTGGKNKGHLGNQGKLSEVYVNRIIDLNPTFFVFENVPGLLRTTKHRVFLLRLIEKLSMHYVLDICLLNALDYGVPQDRERIFIVGFQRSWIKKNYDPFSIKEIETASAFIFELSRLTTRNFFKSMEHWFPWPEDETFKGAKKRFQWPKDPVPEGQTPREPDCPAALMAGTYICDKGRLLLKNSKEGFKPKSKKFHQILEGDVSKKSFKRLHRYRYSPAAAYGNNEVHLHPTKPRRLTVRESMMLQSVPNEYFLPANMTLTDKFKTIGNGVPVKLASAVAGALAKFMKGVRYE